MFEFLKQDISIFGKIYGKFENYYWKFELSGSLKGFEELKSYRWT